MLHLLLVIKHVTVNAISWQTCDPHRMEKKQQHMHQTESLSMTNMTETERERGRESLQIKTSWKEKSVLSTRPAVVNEHDGY